jgi:hypothetical protein
MARTLVSPGVSVDIIDESFYAPSGPGTVPFILIASQQDKSNPSGTLAEATTAANAGKVYSVSSRRELLNLFGAPIFPKNASGSAILGSEIAEYGLLTAHSVLEISSRAYVMRANVNLAQLSGSASRPVGNPAAGTLWLDTSSTSWGIFEWSSTTETFTVKRPRVITSESELQGGVPKSSIGKKGDYVIVGTNINNPLYFKNINNTWVLVGGTAWKNSWPTISSSNVNPTLVAGNSIEINTEVITLTGTTVTALAANINSAGITGVSATATGGYLYIFATSSATSDGSTVDGKISINNVSGTPLTALGIIARSYASPAVQLSAHTSVPEWKSFDSTPRPTGSIWVKTTAVSSGANIYVYRFNANTNRFQLQTVNLYDSDTIAISRLDPTRGGLGIPLNSLYMQHDVTSNNTVTFKLMSRASTGRTVVVGAANPTFVIGESFLIRSSVIGSGSLGAFTTITMTGTTATSFVTDVLNADIPNVNAFVGTNNEVVIEHTTGGVIQVQDVNGTPIGDTGIDTNTDFVRSTPTGALIFSNWVNATYITSSAAPVSAPADNTLWYASSPLEVDILINTGLGWEGYRNVLSDARGYDLSDTDPNGPIISATAPTEQSNGSALVYGDIWISTSDLENFPVIFRWQSTGGEDKWVELDKTNDFSEDGVTFGDARWDMDGTSDPVLDPKPLISELLTSNYVDLDAPDPTIFPRGVLLFNTRRSTYNVKEYRSNYYNATNFPLETLPEVKSAWVTASGSNSNGVPYMGRKAVRSMVVAALKSAIDLNEELREDARFFNLIACPGYPELTQNMVALNTARRETAFVIADLPMGLSSDTTTLENYLINTSGETESNEDALVTNNQFVAAFYPSAGLTNDTTGTQVAVPSSHMILRMIVRSDNNSFPWFAPAGEQRGQIDNATAIGYVNRTNGNFVSIGTREGLRDLLYQNRVNPITVFSGIGILNYGQKTRSSVNSALDRINVARLVNYIRYQLERITKPFIFEPNDKITRDEAKQIVESLLNEITANRGLYDYLVVCDESNNTPSRIDRNELHIDIAIEPTKAVEFIYIPVRLKNTGEIENGDNFSALTI